MRKSCLYIVGICLGLIGLFFWPQVVRAFTMTDRAVLAVVRPYPRIDQIEAEACEGVTAADHVKDAKSANGVSVLLDCKTLKPSLSFKREFTRSTYALWCVARSDVAPTGYREPMYLHFYVDGPGGRRQWRMRVNYMHHMHQDIAHLYFDVNEPGEYTLTLSIGHGSRFNLLVDRLEIRDVLSGTFKQGFKTEPTVYRNPAALNDKIRPFSRGQAMRRARDIAASFAPRNSIKASGGMDKEGFYKEFGLSRARFAELNADRWVWQMNKNIEKPWVLSGPIPQGRDELDAALDGEIGGDEMAAPFKVDPKLKARSFGDAPKSYPDINWGKAPINDIGKYTAKDYHAFTKAKSRWPDDGGGYFIPQKDFNLKHNLYFNWMAGGFKYRMMAIRDAISQLSDEWYRTGDPQAAFRGAVMLAHWADHFPSLDHTVQGTMNTIWGAYPFNTFTGRTSGSFGKIDYSGWAGGNNIGPVHAYDKLFNYIEDNQLLADAIGQDIPWVKTPADVIELIDVKLLQHLYDVADRRQVRFGPGLRADPLIAVVQGNNEAGRHMLQQIVSHSEFEHPALLDSLVVRRSRDSTSFIGSISYSKGPSLSAGLSVADISDFARRHNAPALDLTPMAKGGGSLYQAAQWLIETYCAGIHIPGVGNVSGPFGYPTMTVGDWDKPQRVLLSAWERFGDARFAWMLEHVYGYPLTIDNQIREKARQAAATIKSDPRVGQPSRVLGGFGVTILEHNGHKPDLRQRNAVVFRTGYGFGHGQQDQLNLEVFAKGIVALGEFGGRPGYGTPSTGAAKSHCVVTVDGQLSNYGRTSLLADLPASVCTEGATTDSRWGKNVSRFVAMIDAGQDDMYLFDVVRAVGGKDRTYWFHANQTESVDPGAAATAADRTQTDDLFSELEADLDRDTGGAWKWNQYVFSHNLKDKQSNISDDEYQAVWPIKRDTVKQIFKTIETRYLFADRKIPFMHDPNAPGMFVRLSMLGAKGRQVSTFIATSRQVGYRIPCIGVSEQKPADQATVFGSLIEPFQGQAFLSKFKQVPVRTTGSGEPFAAQTKVRKNRHDLLYHSNDSTTLHEVDGFTDMSVAGRFGFVSYEGKRIRAASLVAGTTLKTADIAIEIDQPYYEAKITRVDYIGRTIELDRRLPAELLGKSYFQIGRDAEMFRITHATQGEKGTILHFQKTAESYRSPLVTVVDGNSVLGMLEPEHHHRYGYLTNEDHSKGWPLDRCGVSGVRWLGTGFRGGARMGGPVDDTIVADTDGDGKRILILGTNDQWQEPMKVEVLRVEPTKRIVVFRSLNVPEGYAGSRSWAGSAITNEAGDFISVSGIPGKMGQFYLPQGMTLSESDFVDADKDGQKKFHVYYFGPGDPVRLQTHASIRHTDDDKWELIANSPVKINLPGRVSKIFSAADLEDGKVKIP